MEMVKINGWILYTLWAVLGLMMLDLLVGIFRSLVTKSFSPKIILDYLKDILYFVLPLIYVLNLIPLDPSGWILLIFYYLSGIALILHYLIAIKNKWRA